MYHPQHPMILPANTPMLSSLDATYMLIDFTEKDVPWRLAVQRAPLSGSYAAHPALCEDTVSAIEHALNVRRINNQSSNRFYSELEMLCYADWLEAVSINFDTKSKYMAAMAESVRDQTSQARRRLYSVPARSQV